MRKTWLLIPLTLLTMSASPLAAPSVGPVTLNPIAIVVGQPTNVLVTTRITNPAPIPGSVNLQRLDAAGRVVAILGTLRDDGLGGDAVPRDEVFTGTVSFNEPAAGRISLRVSAAFRGVLLRRFSQVVAIEAVVADVVAEIGPAGGTIEVTSAASPLRGLRLTLPPGALGSDQLVRITSLPAFQLPHNPKSTSAHLLAFQVDSEGPELNSPAELRLSYPDADSDGVVDGTSLPVLCLRLYSIPDNSDLATREEASIDETNREVVVFTDHFSKWELLAWKWQDGSVVNYFAESLPTNSSYPNGQDFVSDIEDAQHQWSNAASGKVKFQRVFDSYAADVIVRSGPLRPSWFAVNQRLATGVMDYLTYNSDHHKFAPGAHYACSYGPFFVCPFLRTTLHEWGHVMGLPDYLQYTNTNPYDVVVMWYDDHPCSLLYQGLLPTTGLNSWDIQEVRSLYVSGWTEEHPPVSPPARYGHTVVYDALRKQVVVFGGDGYTPPSTRLNDTWVWDGNSWTQVFPATSPPPRSNHAMAYDAARGEIVLFGGLGVSGFPNATLGDTWIWDGNNWTQRFPATSPPLRFSHSMAFDSVRQEVVLFGGYIGGFGGGDSDTWVWDGDNWTQKFPTTVPPGRANHDMAFDATRGEVLLYSGSDWSSYGARDTWVWDGYSWTQKFPVTSPTASWLYSLAYDARSNLVLLFGGAGVTGKGVDETWVWNGSGWLQLFPAVHPDVVAGGQPRRLAYDEVRGEVLLFGDTYLGGTAFEPRTWAWRK